MDDMTPQKAEQVKEQMREVVKNRDPETLLHTVASAILKLEIPSS
jgi:hypothetical protein